MVMRFRKSVKLCKGVKVNFGKRGMSLSVGGKYGGATFGKGRTTTRASLPGTGISFTQTRSTASKSRPSSSRPSNCGSQAHMTSMSVSVSMNDDGSFIITENDTGRLIVGQEAELVKKGFAIPWPEVKKQVLAEHIEALNARADEFNAERRQIFEMHKLAPAIPDAEDFVHARESLSPEPYSSRGFDALLPVASDFDIQASKAANDKVKGLFKSKERKAYQEAERNRLLADATAVYEAERRAFESEEAIRRQKHEAKAAEDYRTECIFMDKLLSGDRDASEEQVEGFLQELELPVEISVSYAMKNDRLYADLDLPEIEDFPNEVAVVSKTGAYRVKERTKAALKADYAGFVAGLTIFLAANFFCLLPGISTVIVSGYTQRRNSDGDLDDVYVVSVAYSRDGMLDVDLTAVDPIAFMEKFPNRFNPTSTMMLKKIKPFDLNEDFRFLAP